MPTLVSMAADLHSTMASVESSREGDVEPLETSGNERPRDRDVEPRSKRLVEDSTDQTETKITRTKKIDPTEDHYHDDRHHARRAHNRGRVGLRGQQGVAAAPNDDAGKGESGEAKMPSDASQAAPLRSLGTTLSDKVEAGRHKKKA